MSSTPGSRLVLKVAALLFPLAGALGPAAGLAAPEPAAPDPAAEASAAAEQPAPAGRFLLVSADRQSVDVQLGKLVAEGNVEARFDGWLLLADRVEVLEATRSVYASGRVRLIRGDQKLQAGRLRYSELEGSGELEDVYGLLDQEVLDREVQDLESASTASPGPDEPGPDEPDPGEAGPSRAGAPAAELDFACPELSSDPQQRSVRSLLPPGRVALPTLPAPAGCPGADPDARPRPLRERLSAVALGQAPDEAGDDASPAPPAADAAAPGEIRQRVDDVRYRQSLDNSIRFDLIAVRDDEDEVRRSGSPTGPSVLRRPKPQDGRLNRLRFQASRVQVSGNRWTAPEIAFTNDPFTPARSWLIGYEVEAVLQQDGVTRIQARRTRILLSNTVSLPGINNTSIGEEGSRLSIDADRRDRDGFYLGYNLRTLRLGERGKLDLQPQVLLQRAVEGRTDSYPRPGRNLAGPRVSQDLGLGDVFGLLAKLDAPIGRFRLQALGDFSTLNPDNFRAGTRSSASFDTAIPLPGHETARAGAFASYRERIFNGSLGRQTVISSYGAQVGGRFALNRDDEEPGESTRSTPHLAPLQLGWSAVSGSYRAELFNTDNLETRWRTRLQATLSSSLQLWQAPLDPERREQPALRYSPVPIRPGLALDFGLVGTGAYYQQGDQQNTLTLYGGPALTLGRFRDPWFDYTRLAVLVGGTLRDGLSPFSFDRAVDLRTVSFRAAQQLYGPLVLEGGATVNIDDRSRFNGELSNSYLELKLQQRSYELGIFYSPYEGTAGIRLRLNDFSFGGSGSPFVPRPAASAPAPLSESR